MPVAPPPAISSSSDLDIAAEGPSTKKSRVEEDTDFSMASLARGDVTEVRQWLVMSLSHDCVAAGGDTRPSG